MYTILSYLFTLSNAISKSDIHEYILENGYTNLNDFLFKNHSSYQSFTRMVTMSACSVRGRSLESYAGREGAKNNGIREMVNRQKCYEN